MRIYELLEDMAPEEKTKKKKYFLKRRKPTPKARGPQKKGPDVSLDADRTRGNPHDPVSKAVKGSVKEAGSIDLGPLKGKIIHQDELNKLLSDFNEANGRWPSMDETIELLLHFAGDDDVTVVGEDSSGGGSAGGATAGATGAGSIAGHAGQVGIANVGPHGVGTSGKKIKKQKTGSKTPNPVGGLVPYGTI